MALKLVYVEEDIFWKLKQIEATYKLKKTSDVIDMLIKFMEEKKNG